MILNDRRKKLANTTGKLTSLLESTQSLLMLQMKVVVVTFNHCLHLEDGVIGKLIYT